LIKQFWTVKIAYKLFDPAKNTAWQPIRNLPEYHDGDVITYFDDQQSGDIFVIVNNREFAKAITKLFAHSTIMPSIIVDSKSVHMMHYSQYLILNVDLQQKN